MIILSHPSPNYDERPLGVRLRWVIVHYTALKDTKTALEWLCDPVKKVSAHYLICKTGTAFQLVDDMKRAWHAGVSSWKGEEDLNHTSLGVELDNNGDEPYTLAQIHTLLALLEQLCIKHDIPKTNVLGHQDIAPQRKIDPGHHFPWGVLYEKGFALERLRP